MSGSPLTAPPVAAPRIEAITPEGAALVAPGAQPERIFSGGIWTEGPLVLPWDGALIFSDIPNNRIWRMDRAGALSIWRQPADFTNGKTLDATGAIIACEHGTRRVTRTTQEGRVTVIADHHGKGRLNSPNDVVVRAEDGSIWFTDPPYGIDSNHEGYQAPSEQSGNHLYRVDAATGAVEIMADDFDRPNGLAFSPDGQHLYVADSGALKGFGHDDFFVPTGPRHIRRFDVAADGRLSGGTVFLTVDEGVPDGLKIDRHGRIWTSAGDGLRVHRPDGQMILKVLLPEITSNLVFDGPERIFITASSSVYRLDLTGA